MCDLRGASTGARAVGGPGSLAAEAGSGVSAEQGTSRSLLLALESGRPRRREVG